MNTSDPSRLYDSNSDVQSDSCFFMCCSDSVVRDSVKEFADVAYDAADEFLNTFKSPTTDACYVALGSAISTALILADLEILALYEVALVSATCQLVIKYIGTGGESGYENFVKNENQFKTDLINQACDIIDSVSLEMATSFRKLTARGARVG